MIRILNKTLMLRSRSGDASHEGTELHEAVKAGDIVTFEQLVCTAAGQQMQSVADDVSIIATS